MTKYVLIKNSSIQHSLVLTQCYYHLTGNYFSTAYLLSKDMTDLTKILNFESNFRLCFYLFAAIMALAKAIKSYLYLCISNRVPRWYRQ